MIVYTTDNRFVNLVMDIDCRLTFSITVLGYRPTRGLHQLEKIKQLAILSAFIPLFFFSVKFVFLQVF